MDTLYPLESLSHGGETPTEQSLTVLVNRTIPAENEAAFLPMLKEILREFDRFPGTAGSKVFRREQDGEVEFSIVQRFTSETEHAAWMQSPSFARWREEIAPTEPAPGHLRRYSGLDALFVSARAPDAPPRWKMTVILILAVYPMSLALSHWFASTLGSMPLFAGTLLTSVVMVVIMTYVIVPILTWVFQGWLQPRRTSSAR